MSKKKKVALATHYHRRKGAWKKLELIDMVPGFLPPGMLTIPGIPKSIPKGVLRSILAGILKPIRERNNPSKLHLELQKLMKTKLKAYRQICGIALVDLTGKKINKPEFAGWHFMQPFYGASTIKILPVYVLFQLRSDLRYLAATKRITSITALKTEAAKLWATPPFAAYIMQGRLTYKTKGSRSGTKRYLPDIDWLFEFDSSHVLQFKTQATTLLSGFSDKAKISKLIEKIGCPYIASVTVQAGISIEGYNKKSSWKKHFGGGAWIQTDYLDHQLGRWYPKRGPFWISATAYSMATFFTLLAQEKLVDSTSSKDLKRFYNAKTGAGCADPWPNSLNHFDIWAKCGQSGTKKHGVYKWTHNAALLDDKKHRFVLVVLTRKFSKKKTKDANFDDIKMILDNMYTMIKKNNLAAKKSAKKP